MRAENGISLCEQDFLVSFRYKETNQHDYVAWVKPRDLVENLDLVVGVFPPF